MLKICGWFLVVFLAIFQTACAGDVQTPQPDVVGILETLTWEASPASETPTSSSTPPPPTGTSVPTSTREPATETPIPDSILTELAGYGIDPSQGKLGFMHPPISIEENGFENFNWANQRLYTLAMDFVLAADVTWNSAYAEAGCGFVVRSDGKEENPSQYLIGLTRGAQGHVLFAEQVAGEVDLNQVIDIYANGIDPQFEWQNDTTNHIAIVGRGQEFAIYSNGTRLGTITGQSSFVEGFVAFFALNRSGGVRCDFDNAWLWLVD